MTDVCDFHNDCTNGKDEINCVDCTFDNSQCGWDTNVNINEFDYSPFVWKRTRAGTDKIPVDHTKLDATGE